MPFQHPLPQPARFAQGQDTFHIGGRRAYGRVRVIGLILVHIINQPIKERRWRKLFLIAHNYDLPRTGHNAQRIFRSDLARLIDDQQIKGDRPRRQELCHGNRAHKHHGLDPLDHGARILHHPTNGFMTTLAGNFAPDDGHLAHMAFGHLLKMPCENKGLRVFQPVAFKTPKHLHQIVTVQCSKFVQIRADLAGQSPTRLSTCIGEFSLGLRRVQPAFGDGIDDGFGPALDQCSDAKTKRRPVCVTRKTAPHLFQPKDDLRQMYGRQGFTQACLRQIEAQPRYGHAQPGFGLLKVPRKRRGLCLGIGHRTHSCTQGSGRCEHLGMAHGSQPSRGGLRFIKAGPFAAPRLPQHGLQPALLIGEAATFAMHIGQLINQSKAHRRGLWQGRFQQAGEFSTDTPIRAEQPREERRLPTQDA